jgi:hypothetical protein
MDQHDVPIMRGEGRKAEGNSALQEKPRTMGLEP